MEYKDILCLFEFDDLEEFDPGILENKKKIDAVGKFDACWDDKLKFFFKVPKFRKASLYTAQKIIFTLDV